MSKKLLALLFTAVMACSLFAGCTKTSVSYVSGEDESGAVAGDEGDDAAATDANGKTKKTTKGKTSKTKKTSKTTVKNTHGGRKGTETLKYTPIADKGANYAVKGTVKIAVDTVRPTDYDAMFDVMTKLYPNIDIEFDYWTHSSSDTAKEYLTKTMATGTSADIIWDEAGEVPQYITEGWIRPITTYVNADPEAANIPANLKRDYTFVSQLWAVPHQATFEIVAINDDLRNKLNIATPSMKWTMDDYEKMLRAGAAGYDKGICVAIQDLFESYNRFCFYSTSAIKGSNYGVRAYNYNTRQMDTDYLIAGAKKFRAWRILTTGVEGWYEGTQKSQDGTSALTQKLGISTYTQAWSSGKALIEDTGTWTIEGWDNYKFKWSTLPVPNHNGIMPMHIDHCFITSNCKNANMPAAFQLLRFMTYTTNGNLARLTMYDESAKDLYNLNSHIYYPTSLSSQVAAKFNSLKCVNATDKYLFANIKNCTRYDSFKIVPEIRTVQEDSKIQPILNNVTDGLDDGSGLIEPAKKWNTLIKTAWSTFETKAKKIAAKTYK